MHRPKATLDGPGIRIRASLLAWLPIVLVLVAACGGGTSGTSY